MKKNKFSEKQKKFLESYADSFNVAAACREAKIARPTVYRWIREIKAFEESVNSIDESYVDISEAVMKHTLQYGYKTDKGGNMIMVPTGKKTDIPLLRENGEVAYDGNGEVIYADELTHQYSKEALDAAKFVLTRKGKGRGYVESIDINADIKATRMKLAAKEVVIDVTPEEIKRKFLERVNK